MRNFFLVFKQTYMERVRAKSFLLTTLFLIGATILAVSLPSLLENRTEKQGEAMVISENISAAELNEALSGWEWQEGSLASLDRYKAHGQEGKLKGIYLINEENNQYKIEYYSKGEELELLNQLGVYLQLRKTQEIASAHELSAADQQALLMPVTAEKQMFTNDGEASVFVTYLMLMFILMAVMMYGSTIATAVASEKASRVMEVMVTKVNPLAMIFGKIFGVALASLTQFVAFFGAVALFLQAEIVEPAASLGNFELNLQALTFMHILAFFVFFLLGYFLYASIYAVFGSMVSRPEELNGTTMPVTTLIMVSALSGIMFVLSDPTSTLAKALAMIPFSAPFNMIILIMKDAATLTEILLSAGILLATTFAIGWFAAKVYPKGILHFGESLSLKQLLSRNQ